VNRDPAAAATLVNSLSVSIASADSLPALVAAAPSSAQPQVLPAAAVAASQGRRAQPALSRELQWGAGLVMLLAHAAAIWALLNLPTPVPAPVTVRPLMVSMVAPLQAQEVPPPPRPHPLPTPTPTPAAAAPQPRPPKTQPLLVAESPATAESFVAIKAAPAAEPSPTPTQMLEKAPAPAAPPTQSLAPAAPAAPAVKQIAPSALRYLAEPRMTVPLLSRRLGESGLVHLRIVVDAKGRLQDVSLKKSSGFERLDKQALEDIRSARFAPHIENGQPLLVETTALLSYELDR